MSEQMIERIARAWRQEKERWFIIYIEGSGTSCRVFMLVDDGHKTEKPAFGPASIRECEAWIDAKCARAVLLAMREPTKAMMHAATMEKPTWDDDASHRKWQAMIDAAAKE